MIASPTSTVAPQLDAVCLIHGLVLIVLGSVAYAQSQREEARGIAPVLPWLAGFALLQGLHVWFNCLVEPPSASPSPHGIVNVALMVGAYVALFEFGRRLMGLTDLRHRHPLRYLISSRIYLPVTAAVAVGALNTPPPLYGVAVWSAALLGFWGALLGGIALLLYGLRDRPSLLPRRAGRHFVAAAAALLTFGIVDGVLIPASQLLDSAAPGIDRLGSVPEWLLALSATVLLLAMIKLARLFQVEADHHLRAIQEQAQRCLDRSGTLMVALDRRGRITWCNPACRELVEAREGELWFDRVLSGEEARHQHRRLREMMEGDAPAEVTEVEYPIVTRTGQRLEMSWQERPLSGPDGDVGGLLCTGQEIQRKRRDALQQELALKVFNHMPESVLITDTETVIQSVNPAFEASTGYRAEEVVGQKVRILKSGHHDKAFYTELWEELLKTGQWQGEIWNRRKDGEVYPEWLTIRALRNEAGETTHYAGIFSDINTQQHVQRKLQRLAYYDTLTGLPNRAYFYDHLELELARARRDGTIFGVMFLDFDRFKNINDTLGHSVGDAVLKTIAMRLKENVRESDTVARIGGDEFVVLLPELQEARHAVVVADKLMASFGEPVSVQGRDLFVTASVGISIYPFDGDDGETLIKNADTAMYHSKELGRNKFHFYTADMSARFREQLDLENGFRRALENDELYLVYQPQIDVARGAIVGIEALARWRHPDFGDVPPSRFIALAEDSGMIGRLGEWVLRTACHQAKQWATISPVPFRLAINLSAHQLLQHGLCEMVEKLIEEHELDPAFLELELTESVLMQNAESTTTTLQRLSDMGIELSIDDFGTGYSSLSYLKRFAIDKLKIDRSFVKDVPQDANDSAIAATVIAMARNLNLEVIAEGVETPAQRDFLLQRGCHIMQGELFSPPVGAIEITRMLIDGGPPGGRGGKRRRRQPEPA